MVVGRGDVVMVDFGMPEGNEAAFLRPVVILQGNVFNRVEDFGTVLVVPLTSNTFKAKFEGNVLLRKGEANLPKASVVLVSLMTHVNKGDLRRKIGTLSPVRVDEIIDGLVRFIRYDG